MGFPGSSAQTWKLQPPERWFLFVLLLLVVADAVTYARFSGSGAVVAGCYTSIFSFGDSLTDTGNLYFISPPQSPNCLLPPYGETYFHQPSGRCSDGRLIPDFIAEFLGMPYVEPYLGYKNGAVPRGSIEQGVNFAVAGATALGRSFFEEKGFAVDVTTNYSLVVQLGWFKDVLRSLCTSPSSCKEVLRSSLFIVGEIGGNDYGYPLSETKELGVLRPYIPQVISVITSVIEELIDLGAVTLMVPGSLPLGCNPAYLTGFATINKEEYDQSGCLKWLNSFFGHHNELLQIELNRLRVLYPHVNIMYADYFNDALRFYRSPEQFGWITCSMYSCPFGRYPENLYVTIFQYDQKTDTGICFNVVTGFGENFMKVCCGGGGPYNFNGTALCGDAGVIACDDPSQYIYWDGYHFTEAAYRWMTKGLLDGPYTFPKFNVSCITRETSITMQ